MLYIPTWPEPCSSTTDKQRFTQRAKPLDEEGICDNVRQALGIRPLAMLRSVDRAAMDAFMKEAARAGRNFRDEKFGLHGILPAGWSVGAGQRTADTLNALFEIENNSAVRASLYFRLNPPGAPKPGEDPETFLRGEAAKKAADRRATFPEYANQSDSFAFRRIAGQPALSWIGNYTHDGVPSSEYMIRILGPDSVAFLFMSGPTEEIASTRAAFGAFADTLRLP